MKDSNIRRHILTAILLAACLALPGWAQDKGKKPAEKGKAEKRTEGILDQETRTKAAANPELAELLALRTETDELWTQYRSLALTKGLKAHARAIRELPALSRQLEKSLEKLAALAERKIGPADKALDEEKEQEAKLLRKFDKLQDRGGEALKEVEKELGDARNAIQAATETSDLLHAVGETNIEIVPAERLLLEELVQPNEQEEKTLVSLAKNDPELVQGRLTILHLQADLQAAKEGTKDEPADPARAASVERQLKQAEKKFAKYFREIWEPIAEADEQRAKEKADMEEKVLDAGDRPAAKKYQKLLADLDGKLQSGQRTVGLYRKIVQGTLAGEELADEAKKRKAAADDDHRGDAKRNR